MQQCCKSTQCKRNKKKSNVKYEENRIWKVMFYIHLRKIKSFTKQKTLKQGKNDITMGQDPSRHLV